jgi:hypothetical protein
LIAKWVKWIVRKFIFVILNIQKLAAIKIAITMQPKKNHHHYVKYSDDPYQRSIISLMTSLPHKLLSIENLLYFIGLAPQTNWHHLFIGEKIAQADGALRSFTNDVFHINGLSIPI